MEVNVPYSIRKIFPIDWIKVWALIPFGKMQVAVEERWVSVLCGNILRSWCQRGPIWLLRPRNIDSFPMFSQVSSAQIFKKIFLGWGKLSTFLSARVDRPDSFVSPFPLGWLTGWAVEGGRKGEGRNAVSLELGSGFYKSPLSSVLKHWSFHYPEKIGGRRNSS